MYESPLNIVHYVVTFIYYLWLVYTYTYLIPANRFFRGRLSFRRELGGAFSVSIASIETNFPPKLLITAMNAILVKTCAVGRYRI